MSACLSQHLHAAVFIYDGFAAGGQSPGAGEYQSDPDSTNGVNNDSIRGQGPAGIGFNAGDNWGPGVVSDDAVAGVVYPKVLDTGLSYADSAGNVLTTTTGAVAWQRNPSSTFVGPKREVRDTNLSPTLPNTGYFSALLQFTANTAGQIELTQADGSGGNPRDLFFGVNASGNLVAGTTNASSGNVTLTGSSVLAPDTPFLVFGEIVNDGVEDNLRIWINPDLSDPLSGTPEINAADAGAAWVAGNLAFTIREIGLFADTFAGSQFIFDELRIGDSVADVLPFTAAPVPEPSTIALWTLLGLGFIAVRRWRRR